MKLEQPNELQSGFIFVKCSKRTHDDCRKIRDAIIEQSDGYVQEAYTTNAVIDEKTWCVAASALLPASKADKFKRHLRTIRTTGRHPITVKNLKLVLNKQ